MVLVWVLLNMSAVWVDGVMLYYKNTAFMNEFWATF